MVGLLLLTYQTYITHKINLTAIYYAREGFPVHEIEAFHWKKNEDKLKKNTITKQIFLKNNKAPNFGEKFRNIQLAETLTLIGKKGTKAFYNKGHYALVKFF